MFNKTHIRTLTNINRKIDDRNENEAKGINKALILHLGSNYIFPIPNGLLQEAQPSMKAKKTSDRREKR